MVNARCARLLVTTLLIAGATAACVGQVGVSITVAPPPLPVYAQPLCPGPGYVWTPGYWAYGTNGYYWVPGTWVWAPVGRLWTPGYWGWGNGFYLWHPGYWGWRVGFYGGINYGFGYGGVGYWGGYWRNGVFNYNQTVNNINTTNVTNTYNKTVENNVTVNRTSYNGGTGGTTAQPTAAEQSAANQKTFASDASSGATRDPGQLQSFHAGVGESRPAGDRSYSPAGSIPRRRGAVGARCDAPEQGSGEQRSASEPHGWQEQCCGGRKQGRISSAGSRPCRAPALTVGDQRATILAAGSAR